MSNCHFCRWSRQTLYIYSDCVEMFSFAVDACSDIPKPDGDGAVTLNRQLRPCLQNKVLLATSVGEIYLQSLLSVVWGREKNNSVSCESCLISWSSKCIPESTRDLRFAWRSKPSNWTTGSASHFLVSPNVHARRYARINTQTSPPPPNNTFMH